MGWVVNAMPRPLYLRERAGSYCIRSWFGPWAGLNKYVKSRPHRDSIPVASRNTDYAIPTPVTFIVYTQFRNVTASRMTQPGGPRVGDPRSKIIPSFVGLVDEGIERSGSNLLEGAVQTRPRLRKES
jgi:hypothetical protein